MCNSRRKGPSLPTPISRGAKFCFVKVHQFDKPGTQPEHLSAEEVAQLFGGVA